MAKLGSFGEAPVELAEPDTFEYFGVELRINPEVTDADMVDFLEDMGKLDDQDPKAQTAIKDLMRQVVYADDFDTFWTLAKKNRQSIEQRMKVVAEVVAAVGERPTGRSADSSGGPQRTADTSTADFALAAQRKLERAGRPDLAVAALNFRESVESRAATG